MLDGLDDEYGAIVAVISSKGYCTNFIICAYSTLIAHEDRLEQRKSTISDLLVNCVENKGRNQEGTQSINESNNNNQ